MNTALDSTTIRQWRGKSVTSTHPNYANLRGYWKFDEGTGTTTSDASGNGNNGTLVNGPAWISSSAPINGLVAYYPFTNGSLNDSSGNGNNATNYGATPTTDRFGNANGAYSFNGTSNYLILPSSSSLTSFTNNITLEAWVKINNYGSG